MRTVLFVCTGNTCRSPMAEAIARQHLRQERGEGTDEVFVASAGVFASNGTPASREAVAALASLGIEQDGTSKPLTAEMIRKADLVLCMTSSHIAAAQALVAGDEEAMRRIVRLDPEADIDDPVGLDQAAYESVAAKMIELIPRRLEELLAGGAQR